MSMKQFTTKKSVRTFYGGYVYNVGYCDMWYLLRGLEPFGYHAGVYGWNCDFYELHTSNGVKICIATGYRPLGISTSGSFICKSFEQEAKHLWERPEFHYEQNKQDVEALLVKLADILVFLTDNGAFKQ